MRNKIGLNKKRRGTNRRRRDPFLKRHKRFLVFTGSTLGFTVFFMTVVFGGWMLYVQVISSPRLMLKTINAAGFDTVDQDRVLRAAKLKKGRNILAVSIARAEAVIESNPYIQEATVVRILPDTVNVTVIERRPVVLVNMEGLFIMDDRGVLFKRYAPEDKLDIPVVTGLEEHKDKWKFTMGPALLNLVSVLKDGTRFNLANISEINADPVHGFSVVTLKEGIRLDLGSGDFAEKFAMLDKIIEARDDSLVGIEYVDLNNDRGVIVRFAASVKGRGGTT